MKLSIIIVHYRTPELLKLCLKSVMDFVPQSIIHEAIVVDSQSTRETQDAVLEGFPNVKLIPFRENVGYAKGVNEGIKASAGEYILILNPDVILTPQSVETMVKYMEINPHAGLLGPRLLDFKGETQRSYFRFYTPLTVVLRRTFLGRLPWFRKQVENFLMLDTNPMEIQYPDWVQGSAIMASRKGIEKVGVMDENYFLYFEDVDWARRFWDNGYIVAYLPEARMYHYHQRKSRAGFDALDFFLRKETRWHVMSALKYFKKYGIRKKRFSPRHTVYPAQV